MKITLVTDSTCDLSPEILNKRGIKMASLKVLFGEEEFIDKVNLSSTDFYNKMRSSAQLPTTSQVNPNEFVTIFEQELAKGNEVIGLFLSSELSGTYNAASIAKMMVDSDKIHLIDARTTSFGLALLVHKAQDLIEANLSPAEVVQQLAPFIESSQLYGMLDTLENLKKGGRLSAGAAMIGGLIGLKPIIEVKEGVVHVANKARGAKKGIAWMMEQLKKHYPGGEIDVLGVAYANDKEKLDLLKTQLNSQFKIKTIHEIEIGPVVGTHVGEGAIGIAFFKTH